MQRVLTLAGENAAGTRVERYHDPLSQVIRSPPTAAASAPKVHAVAIDDIGQHETASPFVHKAGTHDTVANHS